MYTDILDILNDLTSNTIKYPIEYNNIEYDQEELYEYLINNINPNYEYFNVIGTYVFYKNSVSICSMILTVDELTRADILINKLIETGGFTTPEIENYKEYFDVIEDSKINGVRQVTLAIITKYLDSTKNMSDYDNIFYMRKLVRDYDIYISVQQNPEFAEFIKNYSKILYLTKTSTSTRFILN